MPQHYLLDLLQETWRGPIYTTLFNRVWATDDDGSVTGPSPTYAEPVPGRRFVEVLDAWFEGQLSREQRNRPYVRSIDRTFLRFVYSDLVSHKMDTAVQFELEHLYPVSRLKKVIAASGGPGWPISSIANLALFTKSLNREKSSKTISEHLRSTTLPPDEAQALQKLLLCDVEDVSMDNDTFTREEYLRFLRVRWAVMRAQVASNLSIDMP